MPQIFSFYIQDVHPDVENAASNTGIVLYARVCSELTSFRKRIKKSPSERTIKLLFSFYISLRNSTILLITYLRSILVNPQLYRTLLPVIKFFVVVILTKKSFSPASRPQKHLKIDFSRRSNGK
jgi:hypothetical protein